MIPTPVCPTAARNGCPRYERLQDGLQRLHNLGGMTDEDAEDLALMTCAGCTSDAQVEHEAGGNFLYLLPPEASLTAQQILNAYYAPIMDEAPPKWLVDLIMKAPPAADDGAA